MEPAQKLHLGQSRHCSRRRNRIRWLLLLLSLPFVAFVAAAFAYFPGPQLPIAFTLGTGVGKSWLQAKIDACEEKAIRKEAFTDEDKSFLRDFYTCLYKGARLTLVLPEVAKMMEHYLSRSGQPLCVSKELFLYNRKVAAVRNKMLLQIYASRILQATYTSDTFHMPDPKNLDSYFGLYDGRLIAKPVIAPDGGGLQALGLVGSRGLSRHPLSSIVWRAEVPWSWPSYDLLAKRGGSPHAESFPIPNLMSILTGVSASIFVDNGLGESLARYGLAKEFLAYSEWTEYLQDNDQAGRPTGRR